MTDPRLSALEIALLCRLYYLEPAAIDRLLSPDTAAAGLDAQLTQRLRAITHGDAESRLRQLLADGLAALDRGAWHLTERGRALAYEAGELEIQRLSGLWGAVTALLEHRPPFQRLLDVGSAGGSAGVAIREARLLPVSGTYIAVDISHHALTAGIELSRQSGAAEAGTLRVQATAYQLPLADGSVDCCVSRSTLYYLDKRRALREMARVLKKGGYLIVAVPTIGYMARRAVHGWSTLRLREALKYSAATLFGIAAWLGVNVRPPRPLFSGETRRGLRLQLARIPQLRLLHLRRMALPFVGRPLLLIAEKLSGQA